MIVVLLKFTMICQRIFYYNLVLPLPFNLHFC